MDHSTQPDRIAVASQERRDYLDVVVAGDLDGARILIDRLLRRYSPERIILDVLAPAQNEIGRRWEANECSVADEHVATSITDAALAQVGAAVRSPGNGSLVAVACVEGDWHTVPARMAAELLRAQGWQVRFLGGSLPAEHLERYLATLQPAAACLSCSLPLYLPGALRSIEAAHRAGIPVLAGGRGFGRDEHVPLRLGADAWSRSITASKRQLTAWSRKAPRRLATATADTEAWSAVQLALLELVGHTMAMLPTELPWMGQLSVTHMDFAREDITYLFRLLAVSLLVDDDRIFVEFLVWLRKVLTNRNLPPSTVGAAIAVLPQALATTGLLTPRTERLLESATATSALAGSPSARRTGATKL